MSDGKGCVCGAYSYAECGCPDVDWTPQEIYDLKKEIKTLREAAGKLRDALCKISCPDYHKSKDFCGRRECDIAQKALKEFDKVMGGEK
jgi:hypothetical protein